MKNALHFVGFKHPALGKDPRLENARRVFGPPDFVHAGWDLRARREIADGDVIVFAKGDWRQEPAPRNFDDGDF